MADEEIPCADIEIKKVEPKVKLTPYEEQKKLCLKEIKKLNEQKSSVTFFLYQIPDDKLIKELEEKKYIVKYTLHYDKKDLSFPSLPLGSDKNIYTCSMTIINPKFAKDGEVNFDEVINDFGVNLGGDGEKLLNIFKDIFKQF